jgi:putative membrane protein
MGLLVRLIINGLALWVAAFFVNLLIPNGMVLTTSFPGILVVTLLFGLVNALIKPVVSLLSCPLTVLTLGLFTLVINALMLLFTSWLSSLVGNEEWLQFGGPGNGFVAALLAGIIVSIVSAVLSSLTSDR